MQDGAFIIDSPVHPSNFGQENWNRDLGRHLADLNWLLHSQWNPAGAQMPADVFLADVSPEGLARTLFLESNVDMAVCHHLPLYSWFLDGSVSREKCAELAQRWPARFLSYAGLDPTRGVEATLRSLDEQMEQIPNVVGIKLYPTQVDPELRQFRMDDEELLFPIYDKALEYGLKAFAIHKALPLGPVPLNIYRPEDVTGAAQAYPELNFEVIHSGLAFTDETAQAIASFPNVFANLEVTFMLLYKGPAWFNEVLGQLMFWGGSEKLTFSSGCMLAHPQPLLDAFSAFRFSEQTLARYRIPQITQEDKAAILGGNVARLLGLDVEAAKARIADDEWSQRREADGGLRPVYSEYQQMVAAAAVAS